MTHVDRNVIEPVWLLILILILILISVLHENLL